MSPQTTTTRAQEDTRTITALMVTAVVFSLIGHEIKSIGGAAKGQNQPNGKDPITTGGRIIVGGAVATTLLLLLAHAGEGGKDFAFALAIVTFATTTLVYGGPVWLSISGALSGTPGDQPTASTASTTPTQPTHGTIATASALSNLA